MQFTSAAGNGLLVFVVWVRGLRFNFVCAAIFLKTTSGVSVV